MRDINHAESLIYHELDSRHRGNTPVFLIPVHEGELVKTLYQWGARNCEMHLCQVAHKGHEAPCVGGLDGRAMKDETIRIYQGCCRA